LLNNDLKSGGGGNFATCFGYTGEESTNGSLFNFQGSKQPRQITIHYNNHIPPWCSWGLRSSEILRSVGRWLATDVSGKPINNAVREEIFLGLLDLWRWHRYAAPKLR